MTNQLLNKDLLPIRSQLEETVKDLNELANLTGNEELAEMVSNLRNRLHEPFMFVIVGEVKAGKSSFINALLGTGKEIARVAPQPMTDTVQQILYGEVETTEVINPHLKKIFLPVEILRDIAIVDTPGTNTIVAHHQEITERFIPFSDLIVFVFEAKNPYRQSSWEFFDFINAEWRRKVIFVLQQKDLMPESDLEINVKGVYGHAESKGVRSPQVFAVSAKQEMEGDAAGSGFDGLRAFIRQNITGGKAPRLKLGNSVETAGQVNQRILEGIELRKKQWVADTDFRKDIHQTLQDQAVKSDKQVDMLVENLLAAYDRTTREGEDELRAGLSFFSLLRRSVAGIFRRKSSAKDWLEDLAKRLEGDLNANLQQRLNDGVVDVADSIQQMAKIIDLKIRSSRTILKDDYGLFSDIAERRSNVLRDLQETFAGFIGKSDNFRDASLFPTRQNLAPNLATGSGLAAIGVIIMTVTNGMVFDITGGILTAIGLLFAGVSTGIKRRQVVEGYRNEIAKGRVRIGDEVTENLKVYIKRLKDRIEGYFAQFDKLLEQEEKQLEKLFASHKEIATRLEELGKRLEMPE
ncbi:MAG: dynamin family protein [Lewinellaceae bacterium]|nr:dynamin family protein [Lewinella sp.]MCB9281168.1 dynamin family protein [Lewinellaceae bacterium]